MRLRDNVIKTLEKYNGKLIEIPYTKGISSDALTKFHNLNLVTPDSRRGMLRRLLEIKKISRFIEAHSPISALIGENISKIELSYKVLINSCDIGLSTVIIE